MIIDLSGSFELLRQYRIAWLSGRFGAGKTAMAVAMAEYLASKYGYRVYSNFPLVFNEFDTGIKGSKVLHAVVILDEAGLEMVARLNTLSDRMIAYTRKMDVIFLLPSFIPPGPRLRFLQFYPILNLTGAGIPMAVYGWRVNLAGFKGNGSFLVIRPERIYRMYNSFVAQERTEDLYNEIVKRVENFSGNNKQKDYIQEIDKMLEVTERLSDVAEILQNGIADGNKRKRK
jgi:hypothetical protein